MLMVNTLWSKYATRMHLFGAVSSPAVGNFNLYKAGKTGRAEFGDEAANFLRRNFNVDDGLTSVPTVTLIESSQAICASEFLVSKETVVLRRWERSKQKFGFIKRVDKG